jgi:hypothetical protein
MCPTCSPSLKFSHENPAYTSPLTHLCHMPHPAYSSQFGAKQRSWGSSLCNPPLSPLLLRPTLTQTSSSASYSPTASACALPSVTETKLHTHITPHVKWNLLHMWKCVYRQMINILTSLPWTSIHMLISHKSVIWQVTIIIICYSLAAFIHHFFTLKANKAPVSFTRVLPYGSVLLYYVPCAQLFLQPQLIHDREHSHCPIIYLTSPHISQKTQSLSACIITMATANYYHYYHFLLNSLCRPLTHSLTILYWGYFI